LEWETHFRPHPHPKLHLDRVDQLLFQTYPLPPMAHKLEQIN
jgi:hypothetical protein